MFRNFFKPKIEHADAKVRLTALKALTGEDNINLLASLALEDDDQSVQQQALQQLVSALQDAHEMQPQQAAQLLGRSDNADFNVKLIKQISDSELGIQCLNQLEDNQLLLSFATSSPLPALRKQAVQKISDIETLRLLAHQSSDKNVLKFAKNKISEHKQAEKSRLEAEDKLTQICESLERLSRIEHDASTINRINLLQSHWQEVDGVYKLQFEPRYQLALQKCQDLSKIVAERIAQEEYQQSQDQLCQAICDQLMERIAQLSLDSVEQWPNQIQEIEQQWQLTTQQFTPSVQVSERYNNLMAAANQLNSIIDHAKQLPADDAGAVECEFERVKLQEQGYYALVRQLKWSYSFAEPELFGQIKTEHQAYKSAVNKIQKTLRQQRREIDKKSAILKSQIRQKNLIKANRLYNYVQNLIAEVPKSIQPLEQDKLMGVADSLNELRGLNKFVTAPKKEDLCAQMEALIDSKTEPEELMMQIKALQDKWKSLTTSDAEADDILWDRFKQAADQAYQPCQQYLQALEQTKHQNFQSRCELLQQLEKELAETHWQQVEWSGVYKNYRQYWQQWNALTPVFFSENKPVQQQFETAMNQLKAKLDTERDENHKRYDELIERAQATLEQLDEDSLDAQIEQIKRLQASWKNVGLTHLSRSRKQWRKFQKLCDQVFEFKRNQHQAKLKEQDQHADEAYQLIKQIRQLQQTGDDKLPATQVQYQELKAQFEQISDMPANRQERVKKQFAQACEQYEAHLSALPERARENHQQQLRFAASLCHQIETLVQTTKDQNQLAELIGQWDAIESLPEKLLAPIKSRVDQALAVANGESSYTSDDLERNEQALSDLAIKLEVLFDVATPEYAKARRMEYQLEQLQSGLKPALSKTQLHEQFQQLESQWFAIGAVLPNVREQLESRLQAVTNQSN